MTEGGREEGIAARVNGPVGVLVARRYPATPKARIWIIWGWEHRRYNREEREKRERGSLSLSGEGL